MPSLAYTHKKTHCRSHDLLFAGWWRFSAFQNHDPSARALHNNRRQELAECVPSFLLPLFYVPFHVTCLVGVQQCCLAPTKGVTPPPEMCV